VIEPPETQYAKTTDGVHIAYQVRGEGPLDLIEITNGTLFSIDSTGEQPRWQEYVDKLASFSRLMRYDCRGIGLSDPLTSADPPTVEQFAADASAVLDAAQVQQAAMLAVSFGGVAALLLAATHPERTRALVLVNAYACLLRAADYPAGIPAGVYARFNQALVSGRASGEAPGEPSGTDDLPLMVPSLVGDAIFASWWRRAGHRGASPATARRMWGAVVCDLRPVLEAINVPTLVMHSRDDRFVRVGHGRYLADHIRGAHYVELPGADHVPWAADADVTGEIEEFLTGFRHAPETDRVLATVLFTDIVGSTERAAQLGDRGWRDLLDAHDGVVRRQLERFRAREVNTVGDGFLVTFDGPGRAIQCACAIRDAVRALAIEVRAGLHTGEIEVRGDDVAGMAVHIGARVAAVAGAGEVLVSSTVKDLVAGSRIEFEDRGDHQLKGVPGTWKLFSVTG
jgi:pimeloyl-ACP methyl ester carboxylesterase